MITTSKEMLASVEKLINKARVDLKEAKEELENLNNQLKVEELMFVELETKKDELAEEQKYIAMAIKNEIILQNNEISELEINLKLLYKKHEVLKRDWGF